MTNLLLVKPDLKDLEIFQNNLNDTLLLIDPSLNDFLSSIDSNTVHVGFVYHYQGYPSIEYFNQIEIPKHEEIDVSNHDQKSILSEYEPSGYRFIKKSFLDMLNQVKNINPNIIFDLLTCNVTDSKFIEELSRLTDEYGFVFRYSTNEKGYGGDWIQESHNISIKNIYFNDNIDNWHHVLTSSRTISYVASTFPAFFELSGSNVLRLKQNFTWSSTQMNTDFITLISGDIFDGQGYTIDVSSSLTANFRGLFASSAISAVGRPIIRNLSVNCLKTPDGGSGLIVRSTQKFFEIDNCNTSGILSTGTNSGGICGQDVGSEGNCLIKNCFNSVPINMYGGGICGSNAGRNNGICTIDNCYNNGGVGYGGGGMCGIYAGDTSGNCLISNCFNSGVLTAYAAGFLGQYSGNNGYCKIINSYNKSNIAEFGGGFIAGYPKNCEIINCYNEGNVGHGSSSGFLGPYASTSTYIIKNCFNTGNIIEGGMIGQSATLTNSKLFISQCYSTGILFGGGAFCSNSVGSGTNSIIDISDCYSLNTTIGNSMGGICGTNIGSSTTNIKINNCYTIGTVGTSNSGGIIGSINSASANRCTINNCVSNPPLVGGSVSFISNNNSTDLNNIFSNNNSYIYNTLGWSNTLWNRISNKYPRLISNFQINVNENFSNNDLSGIYFIVKDLKNINFSNSNLSNVDFSNKNLENIDFTNSNLKNVNFTNSNFKRNIFIGAKLENVNLSNFNLSEYNFSNVEISGSNLDNVNLTNSILKNTSIINTTFNNSITGPLEDVSGIILDPNYFIVDNYIIGKDVNLTIKNDAILKLVNLRNNEIVDISNVVLSTNLLGDTETEKYTELIKIFNLLKIPSNKINLKNKNKNGYLINLSGPTVTIDVPWNNTNTVQNLIGGKYSLGGLCYGVAFSPNGKYMTLAHRGTNYMNVFYHPNGRFDLSGEVQNLTGSIYSLGSFAYAVAFSPDGKYMTLAHEGTNYMNVFYHPNGRFDLSGEVQNLTGGKYSLIGSAYSVAFSPDGKYMTLGHTGTNFMNVFYHPNGRFDLSGEVQNLTGGKYSLGSFAYGVAFSPDGKYMTLAHAGTNFMNVFYHPNGRFDLSGEVQNLTGGKYSLGGTGFSVAFSPNGKYMTLGHQGTNRMNVFYHPNGRFDLSGEVQNLIGGKYSLSNTARGVAFSPDGKYMAVAHYASINYMNVFYHPDGRFDLSGEVQVLSSSIYSLSSAAWGVAFSPNGEYMTLAHQGTNYMNVFYQPEVNTNINISDFSNNEYVYLLNSPETNISVNINNQFIANVRKSGSNYIINNVSYSENQKVYVGNYRFITGSFLIEPINIVKEVNSVINNQTITIKYIEDLNINGSINNNPTTTIDASVNYLLYSGFRGSIIKFSLTSNIITFTEDPLFLEFDLPNITNTSKTLKLYKIVNNELVIDSNYPVNVVYSNNKWRSTVPTLSDFVIIDETAPNTLLGGDPFIKSIKSDKVLMLPNSWKKVILYQSDKYKVIGYNEKLKLNQMLKMKSLKDTQEYNITKIETGIYNFNYLVKLEIVNLETNNISILDTFEGIIIENSDNIEEITTKNGLNSVDKNFYYPKKNFKAFMIHLDRGNIITIKIDNYWIDLNNIKIYCNNYDNINNITGELIEHNSKNNITNY